MPKVALGPRGKAYEVHRVLGRGAFGTAYLVKSKAGAAQLVLKRVEVAHMDEKQRADALNECTVLDQLREGPYIVRVYEHFEELGRLWIAMAFCDGGDLAAKIEAKADAKGFFDDVTIVTWLVQLGLALRHAHERKVLHRDLKPQNVFLTADGSAYLGDFGISRVLSSTLSVVNTCVGTPLYLAPEICEGKAYDSKCDVWSLGVLLYELCTLRTPFEAKNMAALVYKVCREEAPTLPESVNGDLRELTSRLLAKDPARRPYVKEMLLEPFLAAAADAAAASAAAAAPPAGASAAAVADKATKGKGAGRLGGETKTSALRTELHRPAEAASAESKEGARREAAAKRDAQREQMRKDRKAAMAGAKAGGSATLVQRGSALFTLVAAADADSADPAAAAPAAAPPAAAMPAATEAAVTNLAGAAEPIAVAKPSSAAAPALVDTLRPGSNASAAEAARVAAAFPRARLLTDTQKASAQRSLDRRCSEVMDRMRTCELGGSSGRKLLNDAQRELVTISRLMALVSRRYVVVRPDEASASARHAGGSPDGTASGSSAPALGDELLSSIGLICEAELKEEEQEEEWADEHGVEAPTGARSEGGSGRWAKPKLAGTVAHVWGANRLAAEGGADPSSSVCVVS